VIAGDEIPVPYDRFRDRVIFPISDWRGRIIAFGGRALDPEAPAKYLNSPETPLFHKGFNLYNGAAARQAAHDGAQIIAVEGYVDVIAMVTAGFPATVAPLGTALTEEQLGLLWKMADEPLLCFDGDKAGQRAAFRALDLALPKLAPGKSLKFALLPEGQDPDDLARSGGRDAVAEVLNSSRSLADMLWTRETENAALDTPERRAALEARIGEIVSLIGNENVRRHYRDDYQARLRALFAPVNPAPFSRDRSFDRRNLQSRNDWMRGGAGGRNFRERDPFAQPSARLGTSSLVRGTKSATPAREALILMAVLHHPFLLERHAEEFAELDFVHGDADLLRRAMLEACHDEAETDARTLEAALVRRGLEKELVRMKAAITHTSDWPAREGAAEDDVDQWWAHVVTLHRKKRTLNRELKEAERALGEEPSEANWAWIRDVQGRLQALEGTEALIEGFGLSSGRPAARSV
jgi:DNA primase